MYKHDPFKAKPWAPGGYTRFKPDQMVTEKFEQGRPKDHTYKRAQRKQQRRLNDWLCHNDEEGEPDGEEI